MRFRYLFIAVFLISYFSGSFIYATEFSSDSFKILDPVIIPGTGFSTSSNYQLNTSFGQVGVGTSTSGNFILKGGFLYFSAPATGGSGGGPVTVQITASGGGGAPQALPPKAKPAKEAIALVDFNGDGEVGLNDLSIILYYYGSSGPGIDRFDMNKDGRVGFIDISILFYYWTE